jgi:peptidoglycan/LPS O-acetylase OafA/YrhL
LENLGHLTLPKFPHIWTVAIEFQFYLIFPFLAAFFAKYGFRYLMGVIVFALFTRALMYLMDGTIQDGAYWTILGRLDQFVIGMIIAAIFQERRQWLSSPAALALALGLVWAWFVVFRQWTGGGFYGKESDSSVAWVFSPLLEASVWALLVMAYLEQKWTLPAVMDKSLAYLGSISYSMYMWHHPIIKAFQRYPSATLYHEWYAQFLLVVLPTVIAVSSLSYFVIERPFFGLRRVYVKAHESDAAG